MLLCVLLCLKITKFWLVHILQIVIIVEEYCDNFQLILLSEYCFSLQCCYLRQCIVSVQCFHSLVRLSATYNVSHHQYLCIFFRIVYATLSNTWFLHCSNTIFNAWIKYPIFWCYFEAVDIHFGTFKPLLHVWLHTHHLSCHFL